MILDVWPQSYNNFLISTREHGKNFPTLIACKREKGASKKGKEACQQGKKCPLARCGHPPA